MRIIIQEPFRLRTAFRKGMNLEEPKVMALLSSPCLAPWCAIDHNHGNRERDTTSSSALSGGSRFSLGKSFDGSVRSRFFDKFGKDWARYSQSFVCKGLPERAPIFEASRNSSLPISFSSWIRYDLSRARLRSLARVLREDLPQGPSHDDSMTVEGGITIQGGQLLVYGQPLLMNVPSNVTFTSESNLQGGFLGASFSESNSHHVVPLGVLEEVRFLCCFRFKLWWMTQRMGSCGKEIPYETQFMLLEGPLNKYSVLLPILDGAFRACLQGNAENELQLCVESGDPAVVTNRLDYSIYMHVGSDPFEVIEDAVRSVEAHLQTFVHREKKKIPGILDYFGWCTWDAFYTDVSAKGVMQGLSSLAEGGTPARFLIIDDGWQSVAAGDESAGQSTAVTQGTQYASRLTHIKENHKFQKDGVAGSWPEDQSLGLRHTVLDVKTNFNLK